MPKMLKSSEDAHAKSVSTFETDEHLRGCRPPRGAPELGRRESNLALGRTPAGHADAVHMAMIGAAASSEHIDMREAAEEFGVLPAQLLRIANVELRGVVEFSVAEAR